MGRGLEEHRGLAADDFHVGLFGGAGVANLRELQHFAFGDHAGRLGDDAHDLHRAQLHHHFEGACIKKVADQHAGRVAPHGVRGRAAAAHAGHVDDVIVQQGRGVEEFDGGCQQAQRVAFEAEGLAGQQHQQGAHAFAARGDDVVADLFHQGDAGAELFTDDSVDSGKIVRHHVIEGLGLHWRVVLLWIARHARGRVRHCQGEAGRCLRVQPGLRTIAHPELPWAFPCLTQLPGVYPAPGSHASRQLFLQSAG